MNIDKFKHQHLDILDSIDRLRASSRAGIVENADSIAAQIIAMSGVIQLHLAVEDGSLYPALAKGDARLARMSAAYQHEMRDIVADYQAFARRWNLAHRLAAAPEQFRSDANSVLRRLWERIRREDIEFYPAIERSTVGAAVA